MLVRNLIFSAGFSKEKPDLTILPEIIPLKEFDSAKHAKLCNDARGTVPPEGIAELNEVPNFLKNLPPAESFQQLLDRIKSKVIAPEPDVHLSPDLDNENMTAFIERMVTKTCPLPETSQQTSSSSTNSRKTKTPQPDVSDETPIQKKRRGRPTTTSSKTKQQQLEDEEVQIAQMPVPKKGRGRPRTKIS